MLDLNDRAAVNARLDELDRLIDKLVAEPTQDLEVLGDYAAEYDKLVVMIARQFIGLQ